MWDWQVHSTAAASSASGGRSHRLPAHPNAALKRLLLHATLSLAHGGRQEAQGPVKRGKWTGAWLCTLRVDLAWMSLVI